MDQAETASPTGAARQAGSEGRPLPLWRNLQFQALWLGQAASGLGGSVADVAYPLAILALTGSAGTAGLFGAIQMTGTLVAGLPAGHLADRYDRRTVVIAAEACRAAVSCVVVAGLVGHWLSLPLLLTAAAVLGAGQAVTGTARLPLVRSVVPAEQLTTALVQDEVRTSGAMLAGPPLGGALYAIRGLAHAVPFLFTAATLVLSMASAVAMKFLPGVRGPARAAAPSAGPEPARTSERALLAGLRVLWNSGLLRAALVLLMMVNTLGVGLDLVIIVVLRREHVPAALIGAVLAASAVGALAGAPLVRPLHTFRPGMLLLGVSVIEVPIVAGLALPLGPGWVAGLLFASTLGTPALRVLIDVLMFRQVPDHQRGRVVGAVMTLIGLGMPAGLAGTGLLLQFRPAGQAIIVLASLLAAGVAYCASKRELREAGWPGNPDASESVTAYNHGSQAEENIT